MTAEELEQALTRIDREESIAYGRIAVLLPANLLVAVMGAVDPLSQAINDALQLDLATLDAARAAPEMTAADGRHPDHACGQVPCPHLALTESSAPEPSSIDVETLARALHSGSHHYRGGADDSLAKTACIQFGWEDSKCMRQAKGLAERYRRLSNLPDRASPNDAARAGTDPREPHGVSGLFHHEPGAPCIVCDRHAALPPAAPEIDVETLARAAYEDRPPIGSRPVPWTPEKRRAWRAWAQRVARRLRYDLPDHAIEEQVDKPE